MPSKKKKKVMPGRARPGNRNAAAEDPATVKRNMVYARVTDDELHLIDRAAGVKGVKRSAFVVDAAVSAARREVDQDGSTDK